MGVETEGGAENDKATCAYSFDSYDDATNFIYSDNRVVHEHVFTSMGAGEHTFFIRCEDDVGNIAYENSTINVILDQSYPTITRIYKDGGKLRINTDEEADCYYTNDRCSFNLEEGESMTSAGFQKDHSATWVGGQTYYIKCQDELENFPSSCLAIVQPDQFD